MSRIADARGGWATPPLEVLPGAICHIATDGSAGGTGSIDDPIDMLTAVGSSSPITQDETGLMREGTYTPTSAGSVPGALALNGSAVAGKGVYTLAINGAVGHPITLRNYPGETVRINGAIHAKYGTASHLTIRGIEIAATPTTRTFAHAADVDYPGVYITGAGCEFINNYIHDVTQIYIMGANGGVVHGNIIGWTGTEYDSGRNGYCIYTHNTNGGDMLIRKNVFLFPFNGMAMGMWSADTNNIRDYYVEDNIGCHGGFAAGSGWGDNDDNNHINRNYTYSKNVVGDMYGQSTIQAGNTNNVAGDGEGLVECTGNYSVLGGSRGSEPLIIKYGRQYNIQNNTFISTRGASGVLVAYYIPTAAIDPTCVIDFNSYYKVGTGFAYHSVLGAWTFAEWQAAMSYDANSTHTLALPTVNVTKIVNNDYEDGRGFVAVYNWEGLASVTVNISTMNITDGARCRYTNCLNPAEYVDFTYDAASPTLTISMLAASWTLRQPTGWDIVSATFPGEPFPDFGLFQVETLQNPGSANDAPVRKFTGKARQR